MWVGGDEQGPPERKVSVHLGCKQSTLPTLTSWGTGPSGLFLAVSRELLSSETGSLEDAGDDSVTFTVPPAKPKAR